MFFGKKNNEIELKVILNLQIDNLITSIKIFQYSFSNLTDLNSNLNKWITLELSIYSILRIFKTRRYLFSKMLDFGSHRICKSRVSFMKLLFRIYLCNFFF